MFRKSWRGGGLEVAQRRVSEVLRLARLQALVVGPSVGLLRFPLRERLCSASDGVYDLWNVSR